MSAVFAPKVVPTTALGRRFRSTTEARWAVFLTESGIAWEYEAETYDLGAPLGWYLPDFWLPGPEWFLEVKPGRTALLDKDYDKAKALHIQTGRPVLVANGYGRPSNNDLDNNPGWIYDIFSTGEDSPESVAAGGSGYRLAVLECGCPDLVYRFEGKWFAGCGQHPGAHIDRELWNRALDAGLAFRPGE